MRWMRVCVALLLLTGSVGHCLSVRAQDVEKGDSLRAELDRHPAHDAVRIKLLIDLASNLERENPGQSVSYALDALEMAQEANLPLLQADALQQAGNSYGMLGANLKQRECYVTARKIFQDQGNYQGEIAALNNLGTVSLAERNFHYARQYLFQALAMMLSTHDERNLAAVYNNLGNMYGGMEDYDSALTYYLKAYDHVREKKPDPVVESIILANIGNTYAESGEYERALSIYHECVAHKIQLHDVYGLSELYLNFGSMFYDLNEMDSSLHYLLRGLELADSISAMEMQELIHRDLSSVYDTLGNTALALRHSIRTVYLLDTLRMEEANSISQATQMRIEAEQAIHQRELAAVEQQDKLRQQRIITIATVIVLGLILLLLFFLFRRYQERRKVAAVLEVRVQERTTELSQSNERLQQALQELEQSNHDLNTFIYRSSHDLRSPLTSISGLLDIIQSSLGDHETTPYVAMVEEKTQHLHLLLERLIESVDLLAREPKGHDILFQELWEDLQAGLRKKPGYGAVCMELEAHQGLTIHTDRACLRVVLSNLLANAIDFRDASGSKQPWCRVSAMADARGCTITVEDNGLGMSVEVQERAFEMFYRGGLQAKGIGNGMGLYTARKTVELIGGSIHLESIEGEGTVLTVWVPRMDQGKKN